MSGDIKKINNKVINHMFKIIKKEDPESSY